MKTTAPNLDQIPLFETKQRGGYRGAHRPKGCGSTVVRVPNDKLEAVMAIIKGHSLKSVTEIKPDQPHPLEIIPGAWQDKYINPKNPEDRWSGRGRLPMWIYQYLPKNGTGNIPDTLLNPNPQMPLKRRIYTNEMA